MREGLEVKQDVYPSQGGWICKVSIILFGVCREGMAFAEAFPEARKLALEEALRLWSGVLEVSEMEALRQALFPLPAPSGSPQQTHQKGGNEAPMAPDKKAQVHQAQGLLLKLMEALRKAKGEEAVMEAFAEADLPYPQIPEDPLDLKRLYAVARRKLS